MNQSNTAGSSANAGNLGSTGQNASQSTSGNGIQTGDQSAGTDQSAVALSSAKQIDPSNTAGSTRVLSPGDDGSVSQANTVGSPRRPATRRRRRSRRPSRRAARAVAPSRSGATCPAPRIRPARPIRPARRRSRSQASRRRRPRARSPVQAPSRSGRRTTPRRFASGARATAATSRSRTPPVPPPRPAMPRRRRRRPISRPRATAVAAGQCDPGRRPEGGHRPGVARTLGRRAGLRARQVRLWVWRQLVRQHRLAGSRLELRLRREHDAVEHRRLVGDLRQQRHDGPGREAGRHRLRDPGARPGSGDRTGILRRIPRAQFGASNLASPVRVKSPGGGGSVNQQNNAGSSATSGNAAYTTQRAARTRP